MKIIITGASGFLGKYLVKQLSQKNLELLLVGRNKTLLKKKFPDFTSCNYNEIEKYGSKTDILIHLAVANNHKILNREEFYNTNVYLFENILKVASKISVKKVINFSTFYVFSNSNDDYSSSKRKALVIFDKFNDFEKINVFCPAIYSNDFKGKLEILNIFPKKIKFFIFSIVSAFKPVLNIKKVIKTIFYLIHNKNKTSFSLYLADDKEKNFVYTTFRKLLNYGFIFSVIILLGWVMIITWILVKLCSNGPGIFCQKRVGQFKNCFTLYKFRTMSVGTKNAGTHEISQSAITKFGHFLRTTKIDELPQIFNIFVNQLNLVGPRPGLPTQKDLLKARDSFDIFSIKPGITGYAQVNNIDMSNPETLAEWDRRYLAMRSILLDLKIFFKTILGSGQGDRISKAK